MPFVFYYLPSPPSIIRAMQVSATIICRNNADKICAALDSLAWVDDIVVVDSGSTDNTVALATAHPTRPRVLFNAWPGYNLQRQFSCTQGQHDWVLLLDADEECSPELAMEIQQLDPARLEHTAILRMPRKNFIARRYVRCWSPDYQSRLVHRARVTWDPRSMPEFRTPRAGFTTAKLRASLLHNPRTPYQPSDFADPRQPELAHGHATHLQQAGKRASLLNLLFRPAMTFLKYYLLRGAFLDGRFGLAIAYKTTILVMLKYSVLYGRELEARQKDPR